MTFEQFKKSICDKDPQVKWALDLIDEEVKEALQQQRDEMRNEEGIADLMLDELTEWGFKDEKRLRDFISQWSSESRNTVRAIINQLEKE